MPDAPHEEFLRWLALLASPLLTGGVVGFLQWRLNRAAQPVQLNLTAAETNVKLAEAARIKAEARKMDGDRQDAITEKFLGHVERLSVLYEKTVKRCSDLEDENEHQRDQIRLLEGQLGLGGKGNGRGV